MRQTSYSARLRRRAEKRATAPSSMKRMSGTSAARSGQFGTAILIPVAAGGRAFARCLPFSGRVSSSWSATMMPVHSAPIPKPGRTVGPLLVDIAAADPGAVCQSGLRLGAVTGVGHARLILERFGRFWGAFSVIDLFLLNALTMSETAILAILGDGTLFTIVIAAALIVIRREDRQVWRD